MNKDYAIVVGIDSYPKLPPLSSARQDANLFAEWLRKPEPEGGGITDPARLQIIVSPEVQTSDAIAEPLQMKIDNALASFGVGDGFVIGRRLYFYFSGHGVGVDFNNVAMLMANASKTALNSNIGLNPYLSFFHARDLFKEIVFIVDCCRDQVKRIQINPMPPIFTLEAEDPPPKVKDYVFLATAHGDQAFAVPDGNGLLTKALVEGLNGAAADPFGAVTSQSLSDYAVKRVEELAKDLKLKQAPKLERGVNEGLVFCRVNNEVPVKVYAAPGITGTLRIRDSELNDKGQQDISLFSKENPWIVNLRHTNVPYLVQNLDTNALQFLNMGQIKDQNYEFQFSSLI